MSQSITYYVYELRHPDTNIVYYVGKGNSRRSRYNAHINEASRLNQGKKVGNRIRAGKTRQIVESGKFPLFVKVYETHDEQMAFNEENRLIMHYGRINNQTGILSNLTDGGEGACGYTHNDESKLKISSAHKGRVISDKQKQKLSEKHTGMKHTDETKKKIANWNKNRKHTEETKAKMSRSQTGRKHSDETKRKMSESKQGKNNPSYGIRRALTEEHKEAIKQSWVVRKLKENN